MEMRPETWKRWRAYVIAICAGAGLGLTFRYLLGGPTVPVGSVRLMNIVAPIVGLGFLAVLPMVMGYLSVIEYLRATPAADVRGIKWFFLPWGSVLLSMAVSVLVKWEGRVCLVFAGPIMLLFSLLGGFVARIAWGKLGERSPGRVSAFVVPLMFLLIEAHLPSPYEIRTVQTEVLIHAPARVVWDNIKSVRQITVRELPGSWIEPVGFPRPLEARLSHEGIGGVRQASFSGGLVFTETVNRWDPDKNLRFSIRANTDSIPRSTLDEHVTIGGEFFDVLDGEYALDQRGGDILLHLTSHERLSTHVNPYAEMWTDAVMRAIQRQILEVIRHRAENEAGSRAGIAE